jgi:hypothetical protein
MRFSIAALATLAMGVAATDYTTEVVTQYTTYCPEATSIVHGSHTYSVSTVCLLFWSSSHDAMLTAHL